MNERGIQHTGENDLSHSMVHYLLTIHKLKETKGYARVTDIAKDLEITKGSVSTALNNLKKRGLVSEEDESKFLSLSEEGHTEVHRILTSRTLLYYFLKDFIKVGEETAHKDSCLMEHLMSDETRTQLFEFMQRLGCHCGEKEIFKFSSDLDICQFKTAEQFVQAQKGDSYLTPENA